MTNPRTGDARDREAMTYLFLATHSARVHQAGGCVRFLVLTIEAWAATGLMKEAEQCRSVLAKLNPQHLMASDIPVADCLRSTSAQSLLKAAKKLCSYEQAEHLAIISGFRPHHERTVSGAEISDAIRRLEEEVANLTLE